MIDFQINSKCLPVIEMLANFDDDIDEFYGVMVNVKRLSDRKKFELPLADLEATDKKSDKYQLLDDYSVWFVNNR